MRQTTQSQPFRSFDRDDGGVAAVEFALIIPVVLALLLGATDVIRYYNADRHLQNAARSTAQIAAGSVSAQTPSTTPGGEPTPGSITGWQLKHRPIDSTPMMMPEVKSASAAPWWDNLQWDGAVVRFTPTTTGCGAACTYTGQVRFAWGAFSCGAASKGLALNTSGVVTVPPGLFGPSDVVVIRLAFDFKPRFTSAIVPSTKIIHQAVMHAEQSAKINLVPDGSAVTVCP